jgi:fumarate hydratase class II
LAGSRQDFFRSMMEGMDDEEQSRPGQTGQGGDYRTEHDSMGDVRVPADALWGAQTARAVENFPISGRRR